MKVAHWKSAARILVLLFLALGLSAGMAEASSAGATAQPAAAAADKLDLNTATKDQLKALPGICLLYTSRCV